MVDGSSKKILGATVLVAEGQRALQDLICEDLEEAGLHPLPAGDISTLLKILEEEKHPIDAFIVDLALPGGDVLNVVNRHRPPGKPLIVTSAQGNKQVVLESIRAGAYDFLEKPYSLGTELTPLVQKALTAAELQQENNQLADQVLHSSKLAALGELSATILHDIRGPLSMIQLVVEDLQISLLEKEFLSKEEAAEAITNIRHACDRIKKLGNHLRDYARADKTESLELIEAEELIRNSCFLVQQKIRKFKIQLSIEVPPELKGLKISCLPNKLEQALMNLMSNACDAMESSPKRSLKVRLTREEDFVTFWVEDSGPGMSEEIQQKIFETFFTTKPKGKGTGLGLKIVRGIIEEHGGELKLKSRIGEGTVFSITLIQNLRILRQA